jgi:hypothetical protein
MDGLHKLIEMLEKRFGKFWADMLLLIAVLGAAAWGIHALFAYLIVPAARVVVAAIAYFRGGPIAVTRTQAIIFSIEGFFILATVVWAALSIKWLRLLLGTEAANLKKQGLALGTEAANLKRQGLELDVLLDRSKEYVTQHAAIMDQDANVARAAAVEINNIVREARAFSDKTFADLHTLAEKAKVDFAKAKVASAEVIEETRVQTNHILDEADARLKSAIPSPQSPPSTEPEKQP